MPPRAPRPLPGLRPGPNRPARTAPAGQPRPNLSVRTAPPEDARFPTRAGPFSRTVPNLSRSSPNLLETPRNALRQDSEKTDRKRPKIHRKQPEKEARRPNAEIMTGSSHAAGRTGLSPPSSLPATHFPFPNSPDGSERPRPADSFVPLRPSPDIFRKARPDPKKRSAPPEPPPAEPPRPEQPRPEQPRPNLSVRTAPPEDARFPTRAGPFSRTVPNLSRSSPNFPGTPPPRPSPEDRLPDKSFRRQAHALRQRIGRSGPPTSPAARAILCPYPCRRLDTASGLSVPSVSEAFSRPTFQSCQSPESICAASSEARRPTCPAHFEASMPSLASFQRISRTARRVFLNFSSPATPILKAIFSNTA